MQNNSNLADHDIAALTTHIQSWESLNSQEVQFERLGGLTNQMWKVTAVQSSVAPKAVILRKFGASAGLIDRKIENYILKGLAEQGVGPKIYAGTSQYRIEKFYDSDMLTPSELNETENWRKMAKVIAELHSVELPELEKTPLLLKVLEEKELVEMAREKARRDIYTSDEARMLEDIISLASEEEISFLKGILPRGEESIAFSHNDIHAQNLLRLKKNNQLLLIDYEYSAYNYRGYDIANYFNEAIFEYHTHENPYYILDETKFPTEEKIKDFVLYYLLFSKFKVETAQANLLLEDRDGLILNQYLSIMDYDIDAFMEEVEEIITEVRVCLLLSHYYWILWSVVMSKSNDDIKFDYIHFAHKRFEIYQNIKRRFYSIKLSDTAVQTE